MTVVNDAGRGNNPRTSTGCSNARQNCSNWRNALRKKPSLTFFSRRGSENLNWTYIGYCYAKMSLLGQGCCSTRIHATCLGFHAGYHGALLCRHYKKRFLLLAIMQRNWKLLQPKAHRNSPLKSEITTLVKFMLYIIYIKYISYILGVWKCKYFRQFCYLCHHTLHMQLLLSWILRFAEQPPRLHAEHRVVHRRTGEGT